MITTIDDVKSFWDNRPCNIRHSKKEIGTLEYFEEVSQKRYSAEPHIIKFAKFHECDGKDVLEIGCGIGTDAIQFLKSGANYTATELSDESAAIAKKRFDVYGYNVNVYTGNAENLSEFLPKKKYDVIYSFGVIHHTPNPSKIVFQLKEYLKKDGVLRIMLYAKNSWKGFMIQEGLDQPEAQYGCPIANMYTPEGVKGLLSDYDINFITQDHIFTYKIPEYKQGLFVKEPWFKNMNDEVFSVMKKYLGWHLLIEAKLK